MHHNDNETKAFLNFLMDLWTHKICPLTTDAERSSLLNIEKLKEEANNEAAKYPGLANKGEYSIKFLYLIAKLLMVQEKTNKPTAYMFAKLLKELEAHQDIYRIVAIATHKGR